MAELNRAEHDRVPRGTRPLAWALLLAALLQALAPVITTLGPGTSPGGGAGADLLITPAGWAFSIWGVIYASAIAQAVAVLVRGADSVPRRLQLAQLVLYLGGTLWIVMAAIDNSVATAAALLLMFVAAADGVLTVGHRPIAGRWFAVLTRAAVGLYAGWVTAAFFLNVSTALVAAGLFDPVQVAWQLVVLVAALLTLLALTAASRVESAYVLAGCWALIGIAAGEGVALDREAGATVTSVASGSIIVLVAAALLMRLRGLRTQTSRA